MDDLNLFYLFPLTKVNLVPYTTKPLTIVDFQSSQMFNKSIENNRPIAVVYKSDQNSDWQEIAGAAIPQIINRNQSDMSLLVFMPCKHKIKLDLNSVFEEDGFLVARGEIIKEDLLMRVDLSESYLKLRQSLLNWLNKHIKDQQQHKLFVDSLHGPIEVVAAYTAYLIHDYDLQYEIMEMNVINDKIEFLYRLLSSNQASFRS